MKINNKHQVKISTLVQIENLLEGINLNSNRLPTQVRQSIVKAKHLIQVETINLYLAKALSISNLDNNPVHSMKESIAAEGIA